MLLSLPHGKDFCSAFQPPSQRLMVAVHTLLADQLHVSAGSAEQAGEASLEVALMAGPVIKLSSAPATRGHLLLQVRV